MRSHFGLVALLLARTPNRPDSEGYDLSIRLQEVGCTASWPPRGSTKNSESSEEGAIFFGDWNLMHFWLQPRDSLGTFEVPESFERELMVRRKLNIERSSQRLLVGKLAALPRCRVRKVNNTDAVSLRCLVTCLALT